MNEYTLVLLACLAVIAVMVVLIHVSGRSHASALATICDLRRTLDQILAGNRHIEETLAQHRRVLNDTHKQIHAVSQGLGKPTS